MWTVRVFSTDFPTQVQLCERCFRGVSDTTAQVSEFCGCGVDVRGAVARFGGSGQFLLVRGAATHDRDQERAQEDQRRDRGKQEGGERYQRGCRLSLCGQVCCESFPVRGRRSHGPASGLRARRTQGGIGKEMGFPFLIPLKRVFRAWFSFGGFGARGAVGAVRRSVSSRVGVLAGVFAYWVRLAPAWSVPVGERVLGRHPPVSAAVSRALFPCRDGASPPATAPLSGPLGVSPMPVIRAPVVTAKNPVTTPRM